MAKNASHRQKQRDWLLRHLPRDAASIGLMDGVIPVHKFGTNGTIDTATTPETIWPLSGLYPFQGTTSFQVEALSDDAADTSAGAGTRIIRMIGLAGDNWDVTTEDIVMNGVTPVSGVRTDWKRTPRAWSLTSGSNGTNVGNITIRLVSGGVAQAYIIAGMGQTQLGLMTTPGDHCAIIGAWTARILKAGGANVEVELGMFTKDNSLADSSWRMRDQLSLRGVGSSGGGGQMEVPILIESDKTDIDIRVLSTTANGISVTTNFDVRIYNMDIVDPTLTP